MKFKKYRMWYACFIYVMRQTNLKLDPRGPTKLLPLLTVELIIPSFFWYVYGLVFLLLVEKEQLCIEFVWHKIKFSWLLWRDILSTKFMVSETLWVLFETKYCCCAILRLMLLSSQQVSCGFTFHSPRSLKLWNLMLFQDN